MAPKFEVKIVLPVDINVIVSNNRINSVDRHVQVENIALLNCLTRVFETFSSVFVLNEHHA